MYQDVRFLNKEERRQFLISSVSERDWKREHRLELLIVSIFQMQVKFLKVCSPFCSTAGTVSKKIPMGGHPEFLARRQEEYQRPLCDLWVTWSSYGVGPGESAYSGFGAINAGNGLQITITCKTKQWLSLSRQYRRVEYSWSTTTQNSQLFTLGRSGKAERPRYEMRQEQIHGLREALGFRWVDIARMLEMSPRTLSRQRQEFGMPLGQQHNFSSWLDTWTILWEAFFQLLHCEFYVILDSSVLPS